MSGFSTREQFSNVHETTVKRARMIAFERKPKSALGRSVGRLSGWPQWVDIAGRRVLRLRILIHFEGLDWAQYVQWLPGYRVEKSLPTKPCCIADLMLPQLMMETLEWQFLTHCVNKGGY
ncbi:hypothetical protein [Pseudovibrio axinellae]|uniref:hypothetical protein n=1 Tax=Pseudovibrio axinellae TaxID=989403 RepID=UPI001113FF59|nr:hypothetical protein [Pseudovibrio axinellae]